MSAETYAANLPVTFDSPLTRLLGVRLPIVQGGMAWLSAAPLVAAVSNAGGLGVLGAARMSVVELQQQIQATKAQTKQPFAVNFPLSLGDYRAHLDVALAEEVPVVITSAGSPRLWTEEIRKNGAVAIHVVPSLRLAQKAEDEGVDALVVEGFDAGGHLAQNGGSLLTVLPLVCRHVALPVIAAGGIVDGYGMASAFCLGASGIQMGTRFLATQESSAPETYKAQLLAATEHDVGVFRFYQHPARALVNPVVSNMRAMEQKGATPEVLITFLGQGRAERAARHDDWQEGLFYAGAGAALIEEELTVPVLFERMLAEFVRAHQRLTENMRSPF